MVEFSWNKWLGSMSRAGQTKKVRKARVVHTAQIEGLEERALLSAVVGVPDSYDVGVTAITINPVAADNTTAPNAGRNGIVFNDPAGLTPPGVGGLVTSIKLGTLPTQGTLSNVVLTGNAGPGGMGTFTYTPTNANDTINDFFTYIPVNADGDGAPVRVSLHHNTTNGVAVPGTLLVEALKYDNAKTAAQNGQTYQLNATDPNADGLVYSALSAPGGTATATMTANGVVTYTPRTDGSTYNETLNYSVTDGFGTVVGGGIFRVHVVQTLNSNNAPVATDGTFNAPSVAVDLKVLIVGANPANNHAVPTDNENDPLTFKLITQPTTGTVTLTSAGVFTYTPGKDANLVDIAGTFSFQYQVSDNLNGTTGNSNIATVTIIVNGKPVADPFATLVNLAPNQVSPLFTLTATDPNNTPANANNPISPAQKLTFNTPVVVGGAPNGVITGSPSAFPFTTPGNPAAGSQSVTFTYTAPATVGFSQTVQFTYTVTDSLGNTSAVRTGVIHVNNQNTAPTTKDFKVVVQQNSAAAAINLSTVPNGNPTDDPLDQLTYSLPGLTFTNGAALTAKGGKITAFDTATGIFNYQPAVGFTGQDPVTFGITDGITAGANKTAVILVNAPPTTTVKVFNTGLNGTTLQSPTTVSGTTFNLVTLGLVNDLNTAGKSGDFANATVNLPGAIASDTLTFVKTGDFGGTAALGADGTFSFQAANGATVGGFTYTVTDANGSGAIAGKVVVHIGVTNIAPQTTNQSLGTVTGPKTGTLTATDGNTSNFGAAFADQTSGAITFRISTPPTKGTIVLDAATGVFTYTPTAGQTGAESFSYLANDGLEDSPTAGVVSLTLGASANQPPVGIDAQFTTPIGVAITKQLTGTDPESGSNITSFIAGSKAPAKGTVSIPGNGLFTYTPFANQSGTDTFTFKPFDGNSFSVGEATITIVIGTNGKPTATAATIGVAKTGTTSGTLTGTDPEGLPVKFTVLTQPAVAFGTVTALTNSATGAFVFTPAAGATGSSFFTFKTNDGIDDSATATITLVVNAPPVATNDSKSVAIGATVNGKMNATDADLPAQTLKFTVTTLPASGTFLFDGATGNYSFTSPTAGPVTFKFKANDGLADSNEATVTINVNGAPTAADKSFNVNVGTQLTGTLPGTDTIGDVLTFTVDTAPTSGTLVITDAVTGAFKYDAAANATAGTITFKYKVTDQGGLSSVGTISLVINTAPTAADVSVKTAAGVAKQGTLLGADTAGDTITYAFVGTPPAQKGTLSAIDQATGEFTYTPTGTLTGNDTVKYTVTDSKGLVATGNVNISINTAPTAGDKTFAATVGTDLTGSLPGTDSDVPADTLNFKPGVVAATKGVVTINAAGTFQYVANVGAIGTDTFTYIVNDGTVDSATPGTITVNLNNVPVAINAPLTVDLNVGVNKDGQLTSSDADTVDTKTFAPGAVVPTLGKVFIEGNGSFTYVANSGTAKGTDTFSFTVTDSKGAKSAEGTITVTIVEKNVAPIITAVTAVAVDQGKSATGTATATDANDGDTVTFTVTQGANGAVTVDATGKYTYTPNANNTATSDIFTVSATDGKLSSVASPVAVTINQAPVAQAGSVSTGVNANATGTVKSSEQNSTFALATDAAHGTVVINPTTGAFTYTSKNDSFVGADTFTFTAADATLTSTPATFTVNVTAKFTVKLASTTTAVNTKKAVVLDSTAGLENVGATTNFTNTVITISTTGENSKNKDVLKLIKGGGLTISGSKIKSGKVVIATINSKGGTKGNPLIITFTAGTKDTVQSVLRQITDKAGKVTTKGDTQANRVITFKVVADGETQSKSITATGVV